MRESWAWRKIRGRRGSGDRQIKMEDRKVKGGRRKEGGGKGMGGAGAEGMWRGGARDKRGRG